MTGRCFGTNFVLCGQGTFDFDFSPKNSMLLNEKKKKTVKFLFCLYVKSDNVFTFKYLVIFF